MNFKTSLFALTTLSVLSTACLKVEGIVPFKQHKKNSNRVNNTKPVNQTIGDDEIQLKVISESLLKDAAIRSSLLSLSNPKAISILNSLPHGEHAPTKKLNAEESPVKENSLIVGFPFGLVGEQNIFGGVITKVTDTENENLGTLKLTDLPPIHVRTVISGSPDGGVFLSLTGCMNQCDESSEQYGIMSFPIVGLDQASGMLMVDFSAVGKELDLISILDPKGSFTNLKTVSADTIAVEYDMKTLIFDIKSKMIPLKADVNDTTLKTTDFTVRWYLKLGSGFNPAFTAREPVKEVGFFTTDSHKQTRITRFSTTGDGTTNSPVKYYIKNVPEQFKPAFAKAIESWNVEFKKVIGKNLLSYEFIDATDPRSLELVTGDIRYNIIEWDLVNKATYGGLGPSIANQMTGETMAAHVLVQGPTIVDIYTRWFQVSGKVNKLLEVGNTLAANKMIKDFETSVSLEMAKRELTPVKIKVGQHLEMNVHSQKAHLEDPIIPKDFEIVPPGMSYEKYMEGYMLEIVAHEIGHNLGLRHNFKGNLGAYENVAEPGSVSRSIMEYLGRPFRHLNTIGPYDRMAISYGYKGIQPKHKNWFCTDEDQGYDFKTLAIMSPECTKADATSDPFSFWESRLNRIIDLLIDTNSNSEPVWTVSEVNSQLSDVVTGFAAYALSAEATGDTWTNFFGKNDRPDNKSEVKAYVAQKVKSKLCNPELTVIIASKESAQAQKKAEENLKLLTKAIDDKAIGLGWPLELDCTK